MNKSVVGSCLASAAFLAACGGGGDASLRSPAAEVASQLVVPTQISHQPVQRPAIGSPTSLSSDGRIQKAFTVGMQCSEMMGFFPVDYDLARSLVPVEYELVQPSAGRALLATPLQDCGGLTLNGSAVAPAPIVHFWIQIQGPDDYVEVAPGAVAKRDYYYSVFEHTTRSDAVRQPVKQIGFEGQPIEGMTLGAVVPTSQGYSARAGGVVEKLLEDGTSFGYRWQEQTTPHPPVAAPVVHSFYHTKNPGKRGEADVRCMVSLTGSGYVQLSVDPQSEISVFGDTLNGQSLDLSMQCSADMREVKPGRIVADAP